MQAHMPSPVRTEMTDSNMVDMSPALQHLQLVICPPGRHMDLDQGALHHRCTPSDGIVVASGGDSDSDNGVVFDQPIHNVTHVPDYPEQMLHLGQGMGHGMVVLLVSSAAEMGVVTPHSSPMMVKASITLWSCSWLGCLAAFIIRSCLTPRAYMRLWRHLTRMGGRRPWTDGFFTVSSWMTSLGYTRQVWWPRGISNIPASIMMTRFLQ